MNLQNSGLIYNQISYYKGKTDYCFDIQGAFIFYQKQVYQLKIWIHSNLYYKKSRVFCLVVYFQISNLKLLATICLNFLIAYLPFYYPYPQVLLFFYNYLMLLDWYLPYYYLLTSLKNMLNYSLIPVFVMKIGYMARILVFYRY